MIVKDLMKTKVFTVEADDLVDRVFFLINFEKVRHLPVMEKNKLVGVVSDRDLAKAIGPSGRRKSVVESEGGAPLWVKPRQVRHIMSRGVVMIGLEESVGKAAATMARRKIGALPVVKGPKLVGIITATDVLRAYARQERELERLHARLAELSDETADA